MGNGIVSTDQSALGGAAISSPAVAPSAPPPPTPASETGAKPGSIFSFATFADFTNKLAAMGGIAAKVGAFLNSLDEKGHIKPDPVTVKDSKGGEAKTTQVEVVKQEIQKKLDGFYKNKGVDGADKAVLHRLYATDILPFLYSETKFTLLSPEDQMAFLNAGPFKDKPGMEGFYRALGKKYEDPNQRFAHAFRLTAKEAGGNPELVSQLLDHAVILAPRDQGLLMEAALAKRDYAARMGKVAGGEARQKELYAEGGKYADRALEINPTDSDAIALKKSIAVEIGDKEGINQANQAALKAARQKFDQDFKNFLLNSEKNPAQAETDRLELEKDLQGLEKLAKEGPANKGGKPDLQDLERKRNFLKAAAGFVKAQLSHEAGVAAGYETRLKALQAEMRETIAELRLSLPADPGKTPPTKDQIAVAEKLYEHARAVGDYGQLAQDLMVYQAMIKQAGPEAMGPKEKQWHLARIALGWAEVRARVSGKTKYTVDPDHSAISLSEADVLKKMDATRIEAKAAAQAVSNDPHAADCVEDIFRRLFEANDPGIARNLFPQAFATYLHESYPPSSLSEKQVQAEVTALEKQGVQTHLGSDGFIKADKIPETEKRVESYLAAHPGATLPDLIKNTPLALLAPPARLALLKQLKVPCNEDELRKTLSTYDAKKRLSLAARLEGDRAVHQGKGEAAKAAYDTAVKLDPDHSALRLEAAQGMKTLADLELMAEKGDSAKRIEYLDSGLAYLGPLLKSHPENIEANELAGATLMAKGGEENKKTGRLFLATAIRLRRGKLEEATQGVRVSGFAFSKNISEIWEKIAALESSADKLEKAGGDKAEQAQALWAAKAACEASIKALKEKKGAIQGGIPDAETQTQITKFEAELKGIEGRLKSLQSGLEKAPKPKTGQVPTGDQVQDSHAKVVVSAALGDEAALKQAIADHQNLLTKAPLENRSAGLAQDLQVCLKMRDQKLEVGHGKAEEDSLVAPMRDLKDAWVSAAKAGGKPDSYVARLDKLLTRVIDHNDHALIDRVVESPDGQPVPLLSAPGVEVYIQESEALGKLQAEASAIDGKKEPKKKEDALLKAFQSAVKLGDEAAAGTIKKELLENAVKPADKFRVYRQMTASLKGRGLKLEQEILKEGRKLVANRELMTSDGLARAGILTEARKFLELAGEKEDLRAIADIDNEMVDLRDKLLRFLKHGKNGDGSFSEDGASYVFDKKDRLQLVGTLLKIDEALLLRDIQDALPKGTQAPEGLWDKALEVKKGLRATFLSAEREAFRAKAMSEGAAKQDAADEVIYARIQHLKMFRQEWQQSSGSLNLEEKFEVVKGYFESGAACKKFGKEMSLKAEKELEGETGFGKELLQPLVRQAVQEGADGPEFKNFLGKLPADSELKKKLTKTPPDPDLQKKLNDLALADVLGRVDAAVNQGDFSLVASLSPASIVELAQVSKQGHVLMTLAEQLPAGKKYKICLQAAELFAVAGLSLRVKEAMKPIEDYANGLKDPLAKAHVLFEMAQVQQLAGMLPEANQVLEKITQLPTPGASQELLEFTTLARGMLQLNKGQKEAAEATLQKIPHNKHAQALLKMIEHGRMGQRTMQGMELLYIMVEAHAKQLEEEGKGTEAAEFKAQMGKYLSKMEHLVLSGACKDLQEALQEIKKEGGAGLSKFEKFLSAPLDIKSNLLLRDINMTFAHTSSETLSCHDIIRTASDHHLKDSEFSMGLYKIAQNVHDKSDLATYHQLMAAMASDPNIQGLQSLDEARLGASFHVFGIKPLKMGYEDTIGAVQFFSKLSPTYTRTKGELIEGWIDWFATGMTVAGGGSTLLRAGAIRALARAGAGQITKAIAAYTVKKASEAVLLAGFDQLKKVAKQTDFSSWSWSPSTWQLNSQAWDWHEFGKMSAHNAVMFVTCDVVGGVGGAFLKPFGKMSRLETTALAKVLNRSVLHFGNTIGGGVLQGMHKLISIHGFVAADYVNEFLGLKEDEGKGYAGHLLSSVIMDLQMHLGGKMAHAMTEGVEHSAEQAWRKSQNLPEFQKALHAKSQKISEEIGRRLSAELPGALGLHEAIGKEGREAIGEHLYDIVDKVLNDGAESAEAERLVEALLAKLYCDAVNPMVRADPLDQVVGIKKGLNEGTLHQLREAVKGLMGSEEGMATETGRRLMADLFLKALHAGGPEGLAAELEGLCTQVRDEFQGAVNEIAKNGKMFPHERELLVKWIFDKKGAKAENLGGNLKEATAYAAQAGLQVVVADEGLKFRDKAGRERSFDEVVEQLQGEKAKAVGMSSPETAADQQGGEGEGYPSETELAAGPGTKAEPSEIELIRARVDALRAEREAALLKGDEDLATDILMELRYLELEITRLKIRDQSPERLEGKSARELSKKADVLEKSADRLEKEALALDRKAVALEAKGEYQKAEAIKRKAQNLRSKVEGLSLEAGALRLESGRRATQKARLSASECFKRADSLEAEAKKNFKAGMPDYVSMEQARFFRELGLERKYQELDVLRDSIGEEARFANMDSIELRLAADAIRKDAEKLRSWEQEGELNRARALELEADRSEILESLRPYEPTPDDILFIANNLKTRSELLLRLGEEALAFKLRAQSEMLGSLVASPKVESGKVLKVDPNLPAILKPVASTAAGMLMFLGISKEVQAAGLVAGEGVTRVADSFLSLSNIIPAKVAAHGPALGLALGVAATIFAVGFGAGRAILRSLGKETRKRAAETGELGGSKAVEAKSGLSADTQGQGSGEEGREKGETQVSVTDAENEVKAWGRLAEKKANSPEPISYWDYMVAYAETSGEPVPEGHPLWENFQKNYEGKFIDVQGEIWSTGEIRDLASPDSLKKFLEGFSPETGVDSPLKRARQDLGGIAAGAHEGEGGKPYNEDRFCVITFSDGKNMTFSIDGMGGHAGGEVAADISRAILERAAKAGATPAEAIAMADRAIGIFNERPDRPPGAVSGAVVTGIGLIPLGEGRFRAIRCGIGDAETLVIRGSDIIYHSATPSNNSWVRHPATSEGKLDLAYSVLAHADPRAHIIDNHLGASRRNHRLTLEQDSLELHEGDLVISGSDFLESFDHGEILKILQESGVQSPSEMVEVLLTEARIRMLLASRALQKGPFELTRRHYVDAYLQVTGREPPSGYAGAHEGLTIDRFGNIGEGRMLIPETRTFFPPEAYSDQARPAEGYIPLDPLTGMPAILGHYKSDNANLIIQRVGDPVTEFLVDVQEKGGGTTFQEALGLEILTFPGVGEKVKAGLGLAAGEALTSNKIMDFYRKVFPPRTLAKIEKILSPDPDFLGTLRQSVARTVKGEYPDRHTLLDRVDAELQAHGVDVKGFEADCDTLLKNILTREDGPALEDFRVARILLEDLAYQFLPDEVPLYRGVKEGLEGSPNQNNTSYWAIGDTEGPGIAAEYGKTSGPLARVIKTTLGEIRKFGVIITDRGAIKGNSALECYHLSAPVWEEVSPGNWRVVAEAGVELPHELVTPKAPVPPAEPFLAGLSAFIREQAAQANDLVEEASHLKENLMPSVDDFKRDLVLLLVETVKGTEGEADRDHWLDEQTKKALAIAQKRGMVDAASVAHLKLWVRDTLDGAAGMSARPERAPMPEPISEPEAGGPVAEVIPSLAAFHQALSNQAPDIPKISILPIPKEILKEGNELYEEADRFLGEATPLVEGDPGKGWIPMEEAALLDDPLATEILKLFNQIKTDAIRLKNNQESELHRDTFSQELLRLPLQIASAKGLVRIWRDAMARRSALSKDGRAAFLQKVINLFESVNPDPLADPPRWWRVAKQVRDYRDRDPILQENSPAKSAARMVTAIHESLGKLAKEVAVWESNLGQLPPGEREAAEKAITRHYDILERILPVLERWQAYNEELVRQQNAILQFSWPFQYEDFAKEKAGAVQEAQETPDQEWTSKELGPLLPKELETSPGEPAQGELKNILGHSPIPVDFELVIPEWHENTRQVADFFKGFYSEPNPSHGFVVTIRIQNAADQKLLEQAILWDKENLFPRQNLQILQKGPGSLWVQTPSGVEFPVRIVVKEAESIVGSPAEKSVEAENPPTIRPGKPKSAQPEEGPPTVRPGRMSTPTGEEGPPTERLGKAKGPEKVPPALEAEEGISDDALKMGENDLSAPTAEHPAYDAKKLDTAASLAQLPPRLRILVEKMAEPYWNDAAEREIEPDVVPILKILEAVGPEKIEEILAGESGFGEARPLSDSLVTLLQWATNDLQADRAREVSRFLQESSGREIAFLLEQTVSEGAKGKKVYLGDAVRNISALNDPNPHRFIDRLIAMDNRPLRDLLMGMIVLKEFRLAREAPEKSESREGAIHLLHMFGVDPAKHEDFPWNTEDLLARSHLFVEVGKKKNELTVLFSRASGKASAEVDAFIGEVWNVIRTQDVQDTILPYTPHGWGHSLEVLEVSDRIFESSPVLQARLTEKFGSRDKAKALVQFIGLFHDAGYGCLAPHEEKGLHAERSGALFQIRFREKIGHLLDIQDPKLLDEIWLAIDRHGADKPGPHYLAASDVEHPLTLIVRMADNLDLTNNRMRRLQVDPAMLKALEEVYRFGHGSEEFKAALQAKDEAKQNKLLERIRAKYIGEYDSDGRQTQAGEFDRHFANPEDRALAKALLTRLNHSSFAHFVGCERAIGYQVAEENVKGTTEKRMVVRIEINGEAKAGAVYEKDAVIDAALYQVYRAYVSFKSLRFNERPLEVRYVETHKGLIPGTDVEVDLMQYFEDQAPASKRFTLTGQIPKVSLPPEVAPVPETDSSLSPQDVPLAPIHPAEAAGPAVSKMAQGLRRSVDRRPHRALSAIEAMVAGAVLSLVSPPPAAGEGSPLYEKAAQVEGTALPDLIKAAREGERSQIFAAIFARPDAAEVLGNLDQIQAEGGKSLLESLFPRLKDLNISQDPRYYADRTVKDEVIHQVKVMEEVLPRGEDLTPERIRENRLLKLAAFFLAMGKHADPMGPEAGRREEVTGPKGNKTVRFTNYEKYSAQLFEDFIRKNYNPHVSPADRMSEADIALGRHLVNRHMDAVRLFNSQKGEITDGAMENFLNKLVFENRALLHGGVSIATTVEMTLKVMEMTIHSASDYEGKSHLIKRFRQLSSKVLGLLPEIETRIVHRQMKTQQLISGHDIKELLGPGKVKDLGDQGLGSLIKKISELVIEQQASGGVTTREQALRLAEGVLQASLPDFQGAGTTDLISRIKVPRELLGVQVATTWEKVSEQGEPLQVKFYKANPTVQFLGKPNPELLKRALESGLYPTLQEAVHRQEISGDGIPLEMVIETLVHKGIRNLGELELFLREAPEDKSPRERLEELGKTSAPPVPLIEVVRADGVTISIDRGWQGSREHSGEGGIHLTAQRYKELKDPKKANFMRAGETDEQMLARFVNDVTLPILINGGAEIPSDRNPNVVILLGTADAESGGFGAVILDRSEPKNWKVITTVYQPTPEKMRSALAAYYLRTMFKTPGEGWGSQTAKQPAFKTAMERVNAFLKKRGLAPLTLAEVTPEEFKPFQEKVVREALKKKVEAGGLKGKAAQKALEELFVFLKEKAETTEAAVKFLEGNEFTQKISEIKKTKIRGEVKAPLGEIPLPAAARPDLIERRGDLAEPLESRVLKFLPEGTGDPQDFTFPLHTAKSDSPVAFLCLQEAGVTGKMEIREIDSGRRVLVLESVEKNPDGSPKHRREFHLKTEKHPFVVGDTLFLLPAIAGGGDSKSPEAESFPLLFHGIFWQRMMAAKTLGEKGDLRFKTSLERALKLEGDPRVKFEIEKALYLISEKNNPFQPGSTQDLQVISDHIMKTLLYDPDPKKQNQALQLLSGNLELFNVIGELEKSDPKWKKISQLLSEVTGHKPSEGRGLAGHEGGPPKLESADSAHHSVLEGFPVYDAIPIEKPSLKSIQEELLQGAELNPKVMEGYFRTFQEFLEEGGELQEVLEAIKIIMNHTSFKLLSQLGTNEKNMEALYRLAFKTGNPSRLEHFETLLDVISTMETNPRRGEFDSYYKWIPTLIHHPNFPTAKLYGRVFEVIKDIVQKTKRTGNENSVSKEIVSTINLLFQGMDFSELSIREQVDLLYKIIVWNQQIPIDEKSPHLSVIRALSPGQTLEQINQDRLLNAVKKLFNNASISEHAWKIILAKSPALKTLRPPTHGNFLPKETRKEALDSIESRVSKFLPEGSKDPIDFAFPLYSANADSPVAHLVMGEAGPLGKMEIKKIDSGRRVIVLESVEKNPDGSPKYRRELQFKIKDHPLVVGDVLYVLPAIGGGGGEKTPSQGLSRAGHKRSPEEVREMLASDMANFEIRSLVGKIPGLTVEMEQAFWEGDTVHEDWRLQDGQVVYTGNYHWVKRPSGADTMFRFPAEKATFEVFQKWKEKRGFPSEKFSEKGQARVRLRAFAQAHGLQFEGKVPEFHAEYILAILEQLPSTFLEARSPQGGRYLEGIRLGSARTGMKGSSVGSAFRENQVYLYSGALGGPRLTLLGMLIHELGHSTHHRFALSVEETKAYSEDRGISPDTDIPLQVRQKMKQAHDLLAHKDALYSLDWADGKESRKQYTAGRYSEFVAEFHLHYVVDGPRLRRHIESIQDPEVREAYQFVYQQIKERVFAGKEYGDGPVPPPSPGSKGEVGEVDEMSKPPISSAMEVSSRMPNGAFTPLSALNDPFEWIQKEGKAVVVSERIGTGEIFLEDGSQTDKTPLFTLKPIRGSFYLESLKAGDLQNPPVLSEGKSKWPMALGRSRVLKPGGSEFRIGEHVFHFQVPLGKSEAMPAAARGNPHPSISPDVPKVKLKNTQREIKLPKGPVGQMVYVASYQVDEASGGKQLVAKHRGTFKKTSDPMYPFEGNLREVFRKFPLLGEKLGVEIRPGGTYAFPDWQAANHRLEKAGFAFRFWPAQGEASPLEMIQHYAKPIVEFPYSTTGSHHFHDLGVHIIGYAALPTRFLQRIQSFSQFILEAGNNPLFLEDKFRNYPKYLWIDPLIGTIDAVTAAIGRYLTRNYPMGFQEEAANATKECLAELESLWVTTLSGLPIQQFFQRAERESHGHHEDIAELRKLAQKMKLIGLGNENDLSKAQLEKFLEEITAKIGPYQAPK